MPDWKDMSDAEFIAEARKFLPILVEFLGRIEVAAEPEPSTGSCHYCGGSGKVALGKACTHCGTSGA